MPADPSKRREYLAGASAGLVGKAASLVSGFLGLWLLNQILAKQQYGTYAFTMATLQLLIVVATAGLDRSVLFRVSRIDAPPGRLAEGAYVLWVLRAVVLVGLGIVVVLVAGVRASGGSTELPDLSSWIAGLAILVPIAGAGQVLAAWHQARGLVPQALLVPRSSEIGRVVLLGLAWWLVPARAGVIGAVVLGAATPLLLWRVLVPRGAFERPRRPPSGDIAYGLKLMLTALADRGVRRLDLLMIGLLTTGLMTAEYAVAAQIATVATLGNELLGPVFTPRMGRYFAGRDRDAFAREYDQNRILTLSIGLAAAVGFVWLGRWALSIFGDYAAAYPILLILGAGYLIKIGFGATGRYLNMAGRANWSLTSTLVLLVAMCGLNLLLIPRFGGIGAAIGTAISFAGVNVLNSVVIWRIDRMPTVSVGVLSILAAACGLLFLAAFERIGPTAAGGGLAVVWLILAPRWWPIATNLLRGGWAVPAEGPR
jgi:O-antigen/teichoic acid export membrane protein